MVDPSAQDRRIRGVLAAATPQLDPARRQRILATALAAARPARKRRALWWLAPALAGCAALVALTWWPTFEREAHHDAALPDFTSIGEVVRVQGRLVWAHATLGSGDAAAGRVLLNHTSLVTPATSLAEVMLDGRFRVFLERSTDAAITCNQTDVRVALARGAVVIHADRRRAYERLAVAAGDVLVEVRGTRFRVAREGPQTVVVQVESGETVVYGGGAQHVVRAGQGLTLRGAGAAALALLSAEQVKSTSDPFGWQNVSEARATPPSPPPVEPTVTPYDQARDLFFARHYIEAAEVLALWLGEPDASDAARPRLLWADALRLAGDRARALVVYDSLSDADPAIAELALFESIGLMRQRGDEAALLGRCLRYEQRFPAGVFIAEVAQWRAELHGQTQ